MGHPKGSRVEREAAGLFHDAGYPDVKRELGEGRQDDVGDLCKAPHLTVQVAARKTGLQTVVKEKVPASEKQRNNRGTPFAITMIKMDRQPWLMCQSKEQFFEMYKYALIGYDVAVLDQAVKLSDHDDDGGARVPRNLH